MIKTILFSCALFQFTGVWSQCTIDQYTLTTNCAQHAPRASVTVSGGQPPYQLVFSTPDGFEYMASFPSNGTGYWSLYGAEAYGPPLSLQVTDANGCNISSLGYYDLYQSITPQVWAAYPCGAGAQLRWNGMYETGSNPYGPSPCGAPSTYSIDGPITVYNGSFANDWVQDAPGLWRLAQEVPPGMYSVRIGETPCQAGVIMCLDPTTVNVLSNPVPCGSVFRLSAALAGALPTGVLMTDVLRLTNVLPHTEPYTALGYTYVGTAPGTTFPAYTFNITGNNAVVDWVIVELRDANDPGVIVHSQPALIQRDGDVVNDAAGYVNFWTPMPPGRYYVALRHRNHLGIMTATAQNIGLDNYVLPVNLRVASTAVNGSNARVAQGSVMCLWPGDGNGNGTIQFTGSGNDRDPVLVAIGGSVATNTVTNVYSPLDLNMNGTISYTGIGNDRDVILQTIGGSVASAVRVQQLP